MGKVWEMTPYRGDMMEQGYKSGIMTLVLHWERSLGL